MDQIQGFAFVQGPVRRNELLWMGIAGEALNHHLWGEPFENIADPLYILGLRQASVFAPAVDPFHLGSLHHVKQVQFDPRSDFCLD